MIKAINPLSNYSGSNTLIKVAKETLKILEDKHYTSINGVSVKLDLEQCVKGTVYYPNQLNIKSNINIPAKVEVVNETTYQAAVRLIIEGHDIVALNFASARNPGGGWLQGSKAQEECLTRCSALYSCLKMKPLFYNTNILCDNNLYTDGMIYSPNVPFFRNDNFDLLDKPYNISIITAPAPNLYYANDYSKDKIRSLIDYRAEKIVQIALTRGHRNLILGAWGCGAFGNDPEIVCEAFTKALRIYPVFERVIFPVFDTSPEQKLYNTFKQILGK